MKVVAIGDIHGRSVWKLIVEIEKPNKVIFVGDYFDTREDISAAMQMHNFKEIIEWEREHPEVEVVKIIGNHDYHYFEGIGNQYISGYQAGAAPAISQLLQEHRKEMVMCYQHENILFSHAGIGKVWLEDQGYYDRTTIPDFCNQLWQYRPFAFNFYGFEPYGDDVVQTPIWIRPKSLMKGNRDSFLKKDYIQVVGHTAQTVIDIKGKSTGGRYYFIDTLGTSGEYLIIEDGQFSVGSVR